MRCFAGSCRFVFNQALALQKERYAQGEKKLSYAELCQQLVEWKSETSTLWLADTPSQALQQTLKDLERAYANFFAKRAAFPRFRKKGQSDRFRYPQGCQLDQDNGRIFLPKLGWLRYRNSREVLGTIKNVTVSQSCGKWFVSIQTEREIEPPIPQGGAVGIDLGITRFATLSDGSFLEPLNSFKKMENKLRKTQRALSRKTKFSNNWKKTKAKIQRIHSRIGNARRDYLHKATTRISKNHAIVCVEDTFNLHGTFVVTMAVFRLLLGRTNKRIPRFVEPFTLAQALTQSSESLVERCQLEAICFLLRRGFDYLLHSAVTDDEAARAGEGQERIVG